MPCPKGTTPPRIRATMPSETRPLPAAMVSRKVSQRGKTQPAAASSTKAPAASRTTPKRRGAARARAGTDAAVALAVMRSDLSRLRALEQALGPEHQDHRHDDVDREQLGDRRDVDGERSRQADDERADRSALDAAEAADDDDGERDDDHADRDARLHRDHRRRERAAERGQEDADRERRHVDARDVDAHARRDLGAVDHRQRDLALTRAVEPPPDGESDDDRERDQEEVVADPGL